MRSSKLCGGLLHFVATLTFPAYFRPSPVSDCSPASFVHWMGKPKASETGAICRNTMEIISPGGLPPPLFLPPPNSLQTRIRVFMGFPAIHLTPESMLILTPQEDVFSELLCQESGAGVFWNFSRFVFLIFVKCISLILRIWALQFQGPMAIDLSK